MARQQPTEAQDNAKRAEANANQHLAPSERSRAFQSPASDGPVSVYIVPLDDFAVNDAVRLSRHLSQELGITVKATLPTGTMGLQPFPGTTQFPVEEIIEKSSPIIGRLPEKAANSAFILLTNRDINETARNFRYLFSWHDKTNHISIVSTSRMALERGAASVNTDEIPPRLYKMTKRAIGEQYFRLPRSSDIRDVMYAPIMSVDDIDRMGSDYAIPLK